MCAKIIISVSHLLEETMSLGNIINKENISTSNNPAPYTPKLPYEAELRCMSNPVLFAQQYFEKPVVSGDYKMALSPTACTIRGIPVIDDF